MSVKPRDRRDRAFDHQPERRSLFHRWCLGDRAFNNQATGQSRFVLGGKGVL